MSYQRQSTTIGTVESGAALMVHASLGGLASLTPVTVLLNWEPNQVGFMWTLSEQPLVADAAEPGQLGRQGCRMASISGQARLAYSRTIADLADEKTNDY